MIGAKTMTKQGLKRNFRPNKPKIKSESVSSLKKKLDAVFSRFIRIRDKGVCFTCGIQKDIKEMQAGHYISRSHNNTRYDEQNVHCQCVGCNIFKSGNMPAYALKLMEVYGPNILGVLEAKRRSIKQWTKDELKALIEKYAWLHSRTVLDF